MTPKKERKSRKAASLQPPVKPPVKAPVKPTNSANAKLMKPQKEEMPVPKKKRKETKAERDLRLKKEAKERIDQDNADCNNPKTYGKKKDRQPYKFTNSEGEEEFGELEESSHLRLRGEPATTCFPTLAKACLMTRRHGGWLGRGPDCSR